MSYQMQQEPDPQDQAWKHGEQSAGSLHSLVRLVVANHTAEELALGYLRYEAIRRMSPRTFGELHRLNLSGRFFDDLVDEALKTYEPNEIANDVEMPNHDCDLA